MNRSVLAVLVFALCAEGCALRLDCVEAGQYVSVSEAEWEVRISIQPGGRGSVSRKDWIAGEPTERLEDTEIAWRCAGDNLEIAYRGTVELLRFEPSLSMAEFGRPDRQSHGLTRVSPASAGSLLSGRHFWEAQAVAEAFED